MRTKSFSLLSTLTLPLARSCRNRERSDPHRPISRTREQDLTKQLLTALLIAGLSATTQADKGQFYADKCLQKVKDATPKLHEEIVNHMLASVENGPDIIILETIRTEPWGAKVKYQQWCEINGYDVILRGSSKHESGFCCD